MDEDGVDPQSRLGAGGADIVDDGLVVGERPARPVLADLGECPVFDGVRLRGAARVVADSNREAVPVAQGVLEAVLPGPGARPVAAAGVGEHEQLGGPRVAAAAVAGPPPGQVAGCEVRGVVGGADGDTGVVGSDVVDAVGQGDALGVGGEVVVVDQRRLLGPRGRRGYGTRRPVPGACCRRSRPASPPGRRTRAWLRCRRTGRRGRGPFAG